MKRDLDTIRLLMEAFEKCPPGDMIQTITGEFPVSSKSEVFAHIQMLIDAGYLEGNVRVYPDPPGGGSMHIKRITWEGYDFLDAVRNNDVWEKVKRGAKTAGSWTVGLLLELAKEEAKQRLGLS